MNAPIAILDEAGIRRIVAEEVGRLLQPLRGALTPIIEAAALARADAPDLLTREQVAKCLQLDLRTLRRAELAGDIPPAVRIGRKIVRWRRDDIENFVRTGRWDSQKPALSMQRRRG